jgi:hypothetical protein
MGSIVSQMSSVDTGPPYLKPIYMPFNFMSTFQRGFFFPGIPTKTLTACLIFPTMATPPISSSLIYHDIAGQYKL